MKIDKDKPLEYDMITIIYNFTNVKIVFCDKRSYSFNELMKKINIDIENYVGVIKLLCENPLDGIVLCYGNYHDNELWKIGELNGYA